MRLEGRYIFLALGIAMMAVAWFWPSQRPIEQTPEIVKPSLPEQRELVLVAGQSLSPGSILSAEKGKWEPAAGKMWPSGAMIRKENAEDTNPYLGRLVLQTVAKGEALLPQNFVAPDAASYIAQQIAVGKRAYTIAIDSKGTATAGNFILPNDRVDIIKSSNSTAGLQSETLLTNIRVLAIGQSIHGEGLSSSGDTATVEVELYEAEILATAQRTGQISLALRNPADTVKTSPYVAGISIIRPNSVGEKSP